MFPLLTAFSVICLADNGRSAVIRNIFGAGGSNEGLGLLSFGFDWTLITQAYPLYWPLQTQVSSWIGLAFGYALMGMSRHIIPLLTPFISPLSGGCYYTDVFQGYSRGLPFMSTALFTGNGSSYNQSAILGSNNQLDPAKYAEVGPPCVQTGVTNIFLLKRYLSDS
jgi:hypothetical protein